MPAETHLARGPADPDEVLQVIRAHAAEILEVPEESITPATRFVEDLDADSLALMDLVDAIEEELGERTVGFSISDEDLVDLHTVGDAVDYVLVRLGSPP